MRVEEVFFFLEIDVYGREKGTHRKSIKGRARERRDGERERVFNEFSLHSQSHDY